MSQLHAVEALLAEYADATAAALRALDDVDDAALGAALDLRDAVAARLATPLAATRGAVRSDRGWPAAARRAAEAQAAHALLERRLAERRDALRRAIGQLDGAIPGPGYGSLGAPSVHQVEFVR